MIQQRSTTRNTVHTVVMHLVKTGKRVIHAVTLITVVQIIIMISSATFYTLYVADAIHHISNPALILITVASGIVLLCSACVNFGYWYALAIKK